MKRITTTLLVIVASIGLAFAQADTAGQAAPSQAQTRPQWQRRGGEGGEAMLQRMSQQLNLTSDQQQKIKDLFAQQREKLQAIRTDQSLSEEQRAAKVRDIRQDTRAQMRDILTPDQQKKLEEMRGQGQQNMAERREDHFERMAQELNLTQEQKDKLKPLMENTEKQMQALHEDQSLSPQDRRAKAQQIHESAMEQARQILTPEQQQKLQQMMQEHMNNSMRAHRGQENGNRTDNTQK